MKRKRSRAASTELPTVSICIPVHNGVVAIEGSDQTWLDACLESVLTQTYKGPLEVSIFDDASDDETGQAIRAWTPRLEAAGVSVVASGSRWGDALLATPAGGIGVAKNRAVRQSTGEFLCFLDVDDVLLPKRVELQLAASMKHRRAIVGSGFVREPADATAHYAAWANGMSPKQLWLEQFRETTVSLFTVTFCARILLPNDLTCPPLYTTYTIFCV